MTTAYKTEILVIDDEHGLCTMLEAILGDLGYQIEAFTDPVKAVKSFEPDRYSMVITDIKMPGMNGIEVLQKIKGLDPEIPVLVITGYATVELSIQALRSGAFDILTKPFEPEEMLNRVRNALRHNELEEENRRLRKEIRGQEQFGEVVGKSPELLNVLDTARKIAGRDIPVTITGESGTGKELVANAIHNYSKRKDKPFIAINCGALPEALLESELFGHRKGAFTGADQDKRGLLEVADGGTLLLDEVGNLPVDVQKALLRFLQEQEFYRLGETSPTRVDVRILAATNADLKEEMIAGRFRDDLYYRLAVVKLNMPPLRKRKTDIPLLAVQFIDQFNKEFGTKVKSISPRAMEYLISYDWPGNIRELRNVIEATLAIGGETTQISLESMQRLMDVEEQSVSAENYVIEGSYSDALAHFEHSYFVKLLAKASGNVEVAAQMAELNIATLYRKIKKYNLR
ncbi:MAG: sigma-54-dependent Fis family transcriptional regulator [Desulfobulbaceae bacterium]|nr:MAG: sigma-54-dependent Fis family transcriptional regulator [Desulfobulbaceae bacterium]